MRNVLVYCFATALIALAWVQPATGLDHTMTPIAKLATVRPDCTGGGSRNSDHVQSASGCRPRITLKSLVAEPTSVDVTVTGPPEVINELRDDAVVPQVDLESAGVDLRHGSKVLEVKVDLANVETTIQPPTAASAALPSAK